MNSEVIASAEASLEIEEELADFAADLLAMKANEPILHRLFATPPGCWSDLAVFLDAHT